MEAITGTVRSNTSKHNDAVDKIMDWMNAQPGVSTVRRDDRRIIIHMADGKEIAAIVKSDRFLGQSEHCLFEAFYIRHLATGSKCIAPGTGWSFDVDFLIFYAPETEQMYVLDYRLFRSETSECFREQFEVAGAKGFLLGSKSIVTSSPSLTTVNLRVPLIKLSHKIIGISTADTDTMDLCSCCSGTAARSVTSSVGLFGIDVRRRGDLFREEVLDWLRGRPGVTGITKEDGTTGPVLILIMDDGSEVRFMLQTDVNLPCERTCLLFEVFAIDHGSTTGQHFGPGIGMEDRADYYIFARAPTRQVHFMQLENFRKVANHYLQEKRQVAEIRGWISGTRSALSLLVPSAIVTHDTYSLDDADASPIA